MSQACQGLRPASSHQFRRQARSGHCPSPPFSNALTRLSILVHVWRMQKLILATALALTPGATSHAGDYPAETVPFTSVRLTVGCWLIAATNAAVTMPFALEQCETSGRIKTSILPPR